MHVINYLLLIERASYEALLQLDVRIVVSQTLSLAVVKGWLPETNIYVHVAVVATIHNSLSSRLSGCLLLFSHSIYWCCYNEATYVWPCSACCLGMRHSVST